MKNNNGLFKANGINYLVPFILITTLFFLWGFARAILDVLNKHFQNTLDITITESSLIQVTTYLGYFLMAIPAGLFINRFGYRRGIVFGLLLFGIGSLLFVPCTEAGTFFSFLIPLFIISSGLVFLETAANPYVTELGAKETGSSRLNLSQAFNGRCFRSRRRWTAPVQRRRERKHRPTLRHSRHCSTSHRGSLHEGASARDQL